MPLEQTLRRLTALLLRHRPLWQERAFVQQRLSWEADHPALSAWLRALSPRQVRDLDLDHTSLQRQAPEPLASWAREAALHTGLAALEHGALDLPAGDRLAWGIPGRKREQIAAFAGAVQRLVPAGIPLVDWCAGKGHLGRVLAARLGRDVTCLERHGALSQAGHQLARRAGVTCHQRTVDVFDAAARRSLRGAAAVALHACGDLHRELMIRGAQQRCPALVIAPCCYHHVLDHPGGRPAERARARPKTSRFSSPLCEAPARPGYRPISQVGQQLDPGDWLDQHALRLATAEQVVASPRVARMREREQAWRLALDLLLRRICGDDRYRNMPPVPARWVRRSLEQFCQAAARAHGFDLPEVDMAALERQAWRRLRQVHALGLVRGVFRRVIELWAVLDHALYLQQQGYQVQLGTFCAREVTPRNLLLVARLEP